MDCRPKPFLLISVVQYFVARLLLCRMIQDPNEGSGARKRMHVTRIPFGENFVPLRAWFEVSGSVTSQLSRSRRYVRYGTARREGGD